MTLLFLHANLAFYSGVAVYYIPLIQLLTVYKVHIRSVSNIVRICVERHIIQPGYNPEERNIPLGAVHKLRHTVRGGISDLWQNVTGGPVLWCHKSQIKKFLKSLCRYWSSCGLNVESYKSAENHLKSLHKESVSVLKLPEKKTSSPKNRS